MSVIVMRMLELFVKVCALQYYIVHPSRKANIIIDSDISRVYCGTYLGVLTRILVVDNYCSRFSYTTGTIYNSCDFISISCTCIST